MTKKKNAQLIGILGIVCVVVLGVFFALNQKEDDSIFSKEEKANTEAQTILSKDIDRNYPATVREVVRLFSRISKCYYNEQISETEFNDLVFIQRKLFDDEFLEENPMETFKSNLLTEIETIKETKSLMMSYRVQNQSSVVTWEAEENHFAKIIASYTMKGASDYTKTYEEFLLREDENGRWKIVGWRLTDPIEIEE